jgi:crotonobetainyl-CoA:carnitine CoA-transferase CaiB-like acyl-CoA transferase
LEDPRYCNPYVRAQHLDELYQMMVPIIASTTSAEWLARLEEYDVPCSPVRTTQDLVTDPALVSAGVLSEHDHPTEGRIRLLGNPVRFTAAPNSIRRLPPNLGEHTREVLAELGWSPEQIDAMVGAASAATTVGAEP